MKSQRNWRGVVAVLALVAGALLFARWCKGFVELDRCLDRGGRWDYDAGVCDLEPAVALDAGPPASDDREPLDQLLKAERLVPLEPWRAKAGCVRDTQSCQCSYELRRSPSYSGCAFSETTWRDEGATSGMDNGEGVLSAGQVTQVCGLSVECVANPIRVRRVPESEKAPCPEQRFVAVLQDGGTIGYQRVPDGGREECGWTP